ncbi:YfhO family protein [Geobacter grbiciae]|uniref:YfhO family protein n=1 Tax=Geobacter grbiciae TaxID=155042 RepID=UPI001C031045|nr:YfhO family protein [Geobacter grbiciae]MBT1075047.1 hypothetical protein [Geobacter grbiciae]
MESNKRPLLEQNWFWITAMVVILIGVFSPMLFTGKIIRASDVITQLFWNVKAVKDQSLLDYIRSFPEIFHAGWDPLSDGGRTLEGGWNAINLLVHRYLIQHFFPFPASIAWLAVLAMCWGAAGTFLYCRLIGTGPFGAFVAGLLYVLCTENASLINAGHIQKLEAICWFPWVFLFLEKALRNGRLFHYALAALMLAIQFFHMHWQISFYSCLAVGVYWCWHVGARFLAERGGYAKPFCRDVSLVVAMVVLFFSTIAMSFAPLVSWSQQSERGDSVAGTVAGSGKDKGIGYEEGMSWSMPPEEVLTFVVPGLLGFSRQEGGDVPSPGQVYYWGRMRFTQTGDYLGLLPWFMLPLPLIFRRDRYTWFFTLFMAVTLVMALGKYTFVYRFMFDYLPAFSKFRVPKMILFLFAFGAAVLTGRGIDLLEKEAAAREKLRWWLAGAALSVAAVGALWLILRGSAAWLSENAAEYIAAPTRYQQNGGGLAPQRYDFMLRETAIAFGVASLYLAVLLAWFRRWLPARVVFLSLAVLLVADLWRVNQHFFVLTTSPQSDRKAAQNDIVRFLEPRIDHYRMQPLSDENAHYYADYGFANLSAYVTISERRYKEFLEGFNLMSGMPDIMNLRYVIMPAADYEAQKGMMAGKYVPVFASSNGSVVLENRTVLPKAWLVPSVAEVVDPQQRISIMSSDPTFSPAIVALTESRPPLPLAPFGQSAAAGTTKVKVYTPNRIVVEAAASSNALLVLGEKYYRWWYAWVDGKPEEIYPVDHVLRGVYLLPGIHTVEFRFDPLPFKVGKYLTLASLALFAVMLGREWRLRNRVKSEG